MNNIYYISVANSKINNTFFRFSVETITNHLKKSRYIKLLISCLAILITSLTCFGSTDYYKKNMPPTADPVIISGRDIPKMVALEIHGLRMFSYRGGAYVPIPFQIDQRNSDGDWVWDVALDQEKTFDDEDTKGKKIFDENDLLIFLSKDTGDRGGSSRKYLNATLVMEIEVIEPVTNSSGWVYLAFYGSDIPDDSNIRYMNYIPNEQRVVSPIYELVYSKEHIAVLKEMKLKGKQVLDRLKFRINAKLKLGFLKFPMNFNEEDPTGYIDGYINGPVRTLVRTVVSLRLPLGMKISDINCDHFYYPEHYEAPLLFSIRTLVKNASIFLTADYRRYPFREAYSDENKLPFILGKNSPNISQSILNMKGNWIALSGNLGSVLNMVKLPDNVKEYCSVKPYILDDPNGKNIPENYTGSEPEAGFEIQTKPGIGKGDYIIYMLFFLSTEPFHTGIKEKAINLFEGTLKYRVINVT